LCLRQLSISIAKHSEPLLGKLWGVADAEEPFDPLQLTRSASLNQTVITHPVAGPGVLGRTAGELCSRDALAKMALEGQALSRASPHRVADQLGHALRSVKARARSEAVLREFGRRLGALIATLTQGPGLTETAAYRRAYLSHWSQVEAVSLAGGLLASGTATDIVYGAEEVLHQAHVAQPVRVLPWAPYASLLGAARLASPGDRPVIVADLGHTKIKTAMAIIHGRVITRLADRRSTAAPEHPDEAVPKVLRAVTAAFSLARDSPSLCEVLTFSVASYVQDGLPVEDGRRVYSKLGRHLGDLEANLAAETGRPVRVRFVHDGTAAAVGADEGRPGGVITLGSRLAVGFTPTFTGLLDLSPTLFL